MSQDLVVDLNKLVKIKFKEGAELVIRIVEQKQKDKTEQSGEYLIEAKTPIAQAIMGHSAGEEIKYKVEGNIQQVLIVEIQ